MLPKHFHTTKRSNSTKMSEQLISERARRELEEKFQRELQNEVSPSVFVGPDNREYCDLAVQLCEELSELDSRIKSIDDSLVKRCWASVEKNQSIHCKTGRGLLQALCAVSSRAVARYQVSDERGKM